MTHAPVLPDAMIDAIAIIVVGLIVLWWLGRTLKLGKLLRVGLWVLLWHLPAKRKSKLFAVALLGIEIGSIGVLLGAPSLPFFLGYCVIVGYIGLWRRRYKRATAVKLLFERPRDD